MAAVALSPPLEARADAALSAHMVQHVLLTMVAAPLVAAGTGWGRRLHPVVAWLLFAAAGWAVHFTPFFDAAAGSVPLHVAEHAVLAGTAVAFWSQVWGPGARMAPALRLLYLVVAMPQNTFLALAIYSAGGVLYSHYAAGADPLGDQRLGAGAMWVAGDLVLLVAVLAVAAAWARAEQGGDAPTPPGAGRPPSPRTAG